jgi:hypothetical protein
LIWSWSRQSRYRCLADTTWRPPKASVMALIWAGEPYETFVNRNVFFP